MGPYVGPATSVAAAVMTIGVLAYILVTLSTRAEIHSWGRRVLVLAVLGLAVCILAAYRDGYPLSVQAAADASVLPGRFALDSVQSMVCGIGGAVIAFSGVSAVFVKKQAYRRNVFLLLSVTILLKTLVIEVSRAFF